MLFRSDRSLTLRHFVYQRRPLAENYTAVLDHMANLWGFAVRLERQMPDGTVEQVAERKTEKRRRG